MIKRRRGKTGPEVGALGHGCSRLADAGAGSGNDRESIATIQAALDSGISLLNTADFYGMGYSELLKGKRSRAAGASVHLGQVRRVAESRRCVHSALTPGLSLPGNFVGYSLRRLGTDYIDLYEPARIDGLYRSKILWALLRIC